MPHFTYAPPRLPEDDLFQGDVLSVTDDLRRVLGSAFPQFHDPTGCSRLTVLTQTCDLVRRARRHTSTPSPRVTYISLAAMQPLPVVLSAEVAKYQSSDVERENDLCRLEYLRRVEEFVERLLNNNPDGYFYFHDTGDAAIPEPMCAVLPMSIAVSAEYYDMCLSARVIGLKPEFQAKLGWLLGISYSQVATEDWVPNSADPKQFRAMVATIARANYAWADGDSMRELRQALNNGDVVSDRSAIEEFLKGTPSRTDRLLNLIKSEVEKTPELENQSDVAQSIVQRIENHPAFQSLVRIREETV